MNNLAWALVGCTFSSLAGAVTFSSPESMDHWLAEHTNQPLAQIKATRNSVDTKTISGAPMGPLLVNFQLLTASVNAGRAEPVIYKVTATDDAAGLRSICVNFFNADVRSYFGSCSDFSNNRNSATQKFQVDMPPRLAPGSYTLSSISLYDNDSRNTYLSGPNVPNVELTVNNARGDSEAPKINLANLRTTMLDMGKRHPVPALRITFRIRDASSLEYMQICTQHQQTLIRTCPYLYPGFIADNSKQNVDFPFDPRGTFSREFAPGIWEIYLLKVRDTAGNSVSLSDADLDDLMPSRTFELVN